MSTVNIHVKGLDEAKAAIKTLADCIHNLDDKLMKSLGDAMLDDVDKRFMTRGYGTWQPNSPATIRRKGHANVLIDTGTMMASTQYTIKDSSVILTVPRGGRNRSPDVPPKHQSGDGVPMRKIVEVTPQLMVGLKMAAAKWLRDLVLAYGKRMS